MKRAERQELRYSPADQAVDIARRASDLLNVAGREREACEMRSRIMAALEAERGREAVLGIVQEYVELVTIQ